MENNIFINKNLFNLHFQQKMRQRRLDDFDKLYKLLKTHLKPTEKPIIDQKKLMTWINAHKLVNREAVKLLIKNVQYITFETFYKELKRQVVRFDVDKYIIVLGTGNDIGGIPTNFDISKSNFWVLLLAWKYLKNKPYDIIFNLNVAIKLYYPKFTNFVIFDDASYSGNQLVENILEPSSVELLYDGENAYINKDVVTKKPMYRTIENKYFTVHLIVPFFSEIAINKLCKLDITTGIEIKKYISYIIKPYKSILSTEILTQLQDLYVKFIQYTTIGELIPIYFEHKIADDLSTIAIILIKGQVLDNPKKKLPFINSCLYDQKNPDKYDLNPKIINFINKKVDCPIPPYKKFEKIISNASSIILN